MSDRTNFQVYVYECPEDQREAAAAAITDIYDPDEGSTDDLAEGITVYEARVGTADEVAAKLREAAPGASFYLWEDPCYEWLGDMYAYTPELGIFTAACDSYGEPVFKLSEVVVVVREAKGMLPVIQRKMGAPWREDWAAHSPTPAPVAAK
jgi:Protein of unknown function (DUF3145)